MNLLEFCQKKEKIRNLQYRAKASMLMMFLINIAFL